MIIQLNYNNHSYHCDLTQPLDIAIPMGQVKCFYATDFKASPYTAGAFIGAVKSGAPVNFFDVQLSPHGNGTHTECLGHITTKQESINDQLKQFHFIAQLISVPLLKKIDGDQIITKVALQAAYAYQLPEAIIIRTLPNNSSKLTTDYSGTNPPYLEHAAMEYLVNNKVKHLLLDLPSVDREEDEGQLLNHRQFWKVTGKIALKESRKNCTITEMIYVPNEIEDGLYLLNIQIPAMPLDAAPSKPVLYKLFPQL